MLKILFKNTTSWGTCVGTKLQTCMLDDNVNLISLSCSSCSSCKLNNILKTKDSIDAWVVHNWSLWRHLVQPLSPDLMLVLIASTQFCWRKMDRSHKWFLDEKIPGLVSLCQAFTIRKVAVVPMTTAVYAEACSKNRICCQYNMMIKKYRFLHDSNLSRFNYVKSKVSLK